MKKIKEEDKKSSLGIIHADMDAFYASVEVFDNPELKGKPVIVGGRPGGRGVVSSATYEAREKGVHSAMPLGKAQRLCPDAVFMPVRMNRYVEVSRQIRRIFESFTPVVEPLSVDEAFLDVAGCERALGSAEVIAKKIKDKVRAETGLVVSVGVACTKSLAKLASDLGKPDGLVIIRPEQVREILDPLPVGRLWGIGKVAEKRLAGAGINTISQLRQTPVRNLENYLGNAAEGMLKLARGEDPRPVDPESVRKSIGAENTFNEDISQMEHLLDVIWQQADEVAARLRSHAWKGRTITLKVRFADFTTVTRSRTLPQATCVTRGIAETAADMLKNRIDFKNRSVRLTGVYASGLLDDTGAPETLFPDREAQRTEKLEKIRDQVNSRFGPDALTWARLKKNQE